MVRLENLGGTEAEQTGQERGRSENRSSHRPSLTRRNPKTGPAQETVNSKAGGSIMCFLTAH
jgi:hypothetical protein